MTTTRTEATQVVAPRDYDQCDPPHSNGPGVTKTKRAGATIRYTATFEGTGYFPFDMLRFDEAWVATSEGVHKMLPTPSRPATVRRVGVVSYLGFTPARWASFGWTIVR